MQQVHAGQHEVEREEVVGRQGEAGPDLLGPLDDLDQHEDDAARPGKGCQPGRSAVIARPRRQHAARDEPRARQQDEGVEDADGLAEVLLRCEELLALLGALDHEDEEVDAEDHEVPEHENPHARLALQARSFLHRRHATATDSSIGWRWIATRSRKMMQVSYTAKMAVPCQKLIEPSQENGPSLKMKIGAASTSVTTFQMVT